MTGNITTSVGLASQTGQEPSLTVAPEKCCARPGPHVHATPPVAVVAPEPVSVTVPDVGIKVTLDDVIAAAVAEVDLEESNVPAPEPVTLDFRCPTCGVIGNDKVCVTAGGNEAAKWHASRTPQPKKPGEGNGPPANAPKVSKLISITGEELRSTPQVDVYNETNQPSMDLETGIITGVK